MVMTVNSFTSKWLGKRSDIDGVFRFQCVDLIKQYILELFGIPVQPMGNAIQWWTRTKPALLSKFDKIATQRPQPGDIVPLHGLRGNSYGHIVIALSSVSHGHFLALEQNGSTGNGSGTGADAIRTRQIPITRIAGVLRPKSSINPNLPTYYTMKSGDTFWALERAWGLKNGTLTRLNPTLNPRALSIGQRIRRS
jgi:cell wall-associated NlpC family hydrolase